MKSKKLFPFFSILLFPLMVSAQESEKYEVPLSDPSAQVTLKISLINGGISVKGYSGKLVIVEAKTSFESDDVVTPLPPGKYTPGSFGGNNNSDRNKKKNKAAGMKRIPNLSNGLSIEEDNNVVTIGSGRWGGNSKTDLFIQVPFNTTCKLSTINDGNIEVENVSGNHETSNNNGDITMKSISGSALVNALNGEILVTFSNVDSDAPMSFSSLNGDIDVTFPSNLKSDVYIKNEMGEIYSDFDVSLEKPKAKSDENGSGKKGKYKVVIDKGMRGTINGGGQEIQITNFNGDIYLRKAK